MLEMSFVVKIFEFRAFQPVPLVLNSSTIYTSYRRLVCTGFLKRAVESNERQTKISAFTQLTKEFNFQ